MYLEIEKAIKINNFKEVSRKIKLLSDIIFFEIE